MGVFFEGSSFVQDNMMGLMVEERYEDNTDILQEQVWVCRKSLEISTK
jgi:hypothetical protein